MVELNTNISFEEAVSLIDKIAGYDPRQMYLVIPQRVIRDLQRTFLNTIERGGIVRFSYARYYENIVFPLNFKELKPKVATEMLYQLRTNLSVQFEMLMYYPLGGEFHTHPAEYEESIHPSFEDVSSFFVIKRYMYLFYKYPMFCELIVHRYGLTIFSADYFITVADKVYTPVDKTQKYKRFVKLVFEDKYRDASSANWMDSQKVFVTYIITERF
jgi:hypothetical protein